MIISISGTDIEDDLSQFHKKLVEECLLIITLSDGFLRFILGALAWRLTRKMERDCKRTERLYG